MTKHECYAQHGNVHYGNETITDTSYTNDKESSTLSQCYGAGVKNPVVSAETVDAETPGNPLSEGLPEMRSQLLHGHHSQH